MFVERLSKSPQEHSFLELKSGFSSTNIASAKIAKFILGAANRMSDDSFQFMGGHGVMVIGMDETGKICGTKTLEELDLRNSMSRFLGKSPPQWWSHWLPVLEAPGTSLLIICVAPPRDGDPVHMCCADGDGVVDGAHYIRSGASTRTAKSEEIVMMRERELRAKPLDLTIRMTHAWHNLSWNDDVIHKYILAKFGTESRRYIQQKILELLSFHAPSYVSIKNNSSESVHDLRLHMNVCDKDITYFIPKKTDEPYWFNDNGVIDFFESLSSDENFPDLRGKLPKLEVKGNKLVGTGFVNPFRFWSQAEPAIIGDPTLIFVEKNDLTMFVHVPHAIGPYQTITLKQYPLLAFSQREGFSNDLTKVKWSATSNGVSGQHSGAFSQEILDPEDSIDGDITDIIIWCLEKSIHDWDERLRLLKINHPDATFGWGFGEWRMEKDYPVSEEEQASLFPYDYGKPHPKDMSAHKRREFLGAYSRDVAN